MLSARDSAAIESEACVCFHLEFQTHPALAQKECSCIRGVSKARLRVNVCIVGAETTLYFVLSVPYVFYVYIHT